MAKLTLSTIGSRYASVAALNANFDAIEAAFENTLSRDGTSPNTLQADLDLNSHSLLNVSTINGADFSTWSADVTTVTDNIASINTVAASIANVNIDAAAISNINTVATDISNVNAVAANKTNIDVVATDTTVVNTVATNIAVINAVNNNQTNINAVNANSANINTVAADTLAINSVYTNIANVNSVAGNETNINSVVANEANITSVAGSISNVNSVAADLSNINNVAADLTNIDAVAAVLPTLSTKVDLTTSTGSALIPTGTQAQRDGVPAAGYFRFNTDIDKFEGYNGTTWGSVGGGATGGGADEVFVENSMSVTTNYTITTGKSASSVGPISIATGVAVTVPSGSRWVVL